MPHDEPNAPRPDALPPLFVGEAITPEKGSFDPAAMSAGEPGLPAGVTWRGRRFDVVRVLEKWKTTSPCRHGSGERYVRRHWWRVETACGRVLELYFDRTAKRGQSRMRWWLASISRDDGNPPDHGEEKDGLPL